MEHLGKKPHSSPVGNVETQRPGEANSGARGVHSSKDSCHVWPPSEAHPAQKPSSPRPCCPRLLLRELRTSRARPCEGRAEGAWQGPAPCSFHPLAGSVSDQQGAPVQQRRTVGPAPPGGSGLGTLGHPAPSPVSMEAFSQRRRPARGSSGSAGKP